MNNSKPMATRGEEPESLAESLAGGVMLTAFMLVMFWLLANGPVWLNWDFFMFAE